MLEVGQVLRMPDGQWVKVARNCGQATGYRLDQHPANGLVYMPWFRTLADIEAALPVRVPVAPNARLSGPKGLERNTDEH